ncbi:hypothetical protein SDC9_186368 [bioreactor metagenome]|uniref:Uncharacterized protein n=1 Tax=bioreactor metagenome TaxID=1076179 RepID=A0A645HTZ1_9ZZZZ
MGHVGSDKAAGRHHKNIHRSAGIAFRSLFQQIAVPELIHFHFGKPRLCPFNADLHRFADQPARFSD